MYERSTGALRGRGGGIGTTSAVLNALMTNDVIDADFPYCPASEMPFIGRRADDDRLGCRPWSLPLDLQTFHWSTLWQSLRKRVPDDIYHEGTPVSGAEMKDDETVLLRLENGAETEYDLVLFADGYQSLGRSIIFPDVDLQYRGYMLWRGLLPESAIEDSAPLEKAVPRLAHGTDAGNTVMYLIPHEDGSSQPGTRIINWAAYIPLPEERRDAFMIDRDGQPRNGTIPPGEMRIEEEDRLKSLLADYLPAYYADIIARTTDTFVQLIYTNDVPAYHRGRICLIGDAGMVIQPFTGSGVFKGYNNVRGLIDELKHAGSVAHALDRWDAMQLVLGRRLLALGEQMEQAFIWNPIDLANADAESTEAWWNASVRFPESFSYDKRG